MLELMRAGGYFMYPLAIVGAITVVLATRSWLLLRRDVAQADVVLETRIDAILFWGAYGLVVGVLGTVVGIAEMASAIHAAGSVSAGVVWGGVLVSLYTTILALCVFSVSLLLWFVLRFRYRRRLAAA